LMVSRIRKYPTGSFLFWKTEHPPEIKNLAVDREKLGSKDVILDGQQQNSNLRYGGIFEMIGSIKTLRW